MYGLRGRLAHANLKWNFYEVLLHSQDVERHAATTDRRIAEELCDHISASIQWIEAMGFDVDSVYDRRISEKAPVFKSILSKYGEKLSSAIEQAKEAEEGSTARRPRRRTMPSLSIATNIHAHK